MRAFLTDRRFLVAVTLVAIVALVVAVLVNRSPSDNRAAGDATAATTVVTETSTTTSSTAPTPTAAPTGPTTTVKPTATTRDPHFPLVDLPLTVTPTRTTGLTDGATVSFHIVPTQGSQAYGVSIRLCKAGASFEALDDFEPATAGYCIGHALSPNSDLLVETAGNPPYQGLDASFRVGVGTDTYTMTDGTGVSITCGPSSPCQLVLLLQVPNAFGFKTFPVTFG